MFFDVALGFGQQFEKTRARAGALQRPHEIHHARGILQHLHRLDPGDVVEEPTATREHQERTAL
jgi:hypothetical protein